MLIQAPDECLAFTVLPLVDAVTIIMNNVLTGPVQRLTTWWGQGNINQTHVPPSPLHSAANGHVADFLSTMPCVSHHLPQNNNKTRREIEEENLCALQSFLRVLDGDFISQGLAEAVIHENGTQVLAGCTLQ